MQFDQSFLQKVEECVHAIYGVRISDLSPSAAEEGSTKIQILVLRLCYWVKAWQMAPQPPVLAPGAASAGVFKSVAFDAIKVDRTLNSILQQCQNRASSPDSAISAAMTNTMQTPTPQSIHNFGKARFFSPTGYDSISPDLPYVLLEDENDLEKFIVSIVMELQTLSQYSYPPSASLLEPYRRFLADLKLSDIRTVQLLKEFECEPLDDTLHFILRVDEDAGLSISNANLGHKFANFDLKKTRYQIGTQINSKWKDHQGRLPYGAQHEYKDFKFTDGSGNIGDKYI